MLGTKIIEVRGDLFVPARDRSSEENLIGHHVSR